jgi:ABC-2 type transport system permease protein
VWEGGARLMMELLNAQTPDPWFLSTYIGAWMTGRLELSHRFAPCYDYASEMVNGCSNQYAIYWWHAAAVFLVLLAVLVGGAFGVFRRRDLTV